jgi:hypothetical protein
VAIFSTVSGLIYGAWVDGASLWLLLAYLFLFLAFLAGTLYLIDRRNRPRVPVRAAAAGK